MPIKCLIIAGGAELTSISAVDGEVAVQAAVINYGVLAQRAMTSCAPLVLLIGVAVLLAIVHADGKESTLKSVLVLTRR